MTLSKNGKDYIAREWGINGCYVPSGLIYKAVKADGSSVIGGGDTAGVVVMIIQTSIYTRIDLTYPKTKSYTYSELKTANDGIDITGSDADWVAHNDGYISPEQYCLPVRILDSVSYRPSQNPNAPASEGYVEIICTGHGIGSLTTYRDGVWLGTGQITISGAWTNIDDFGGPAIGFGTWDYSVSDGVVTLHVSVTLDAPCVPVWVCESPLNGYEKDGCDHRRLNSACNAACTPVWVCESPLNGYEKDGCGNRRLNSACNALCVPTWVCEEPKNGYEKDGCGNRRTNSACNAVTSTSNNTLIWVGVGAVVTVIVYNLLKKGKK